MPKLPFITAFRAVAKLGDRFYPPMAVKLPNGAMNKEIKLGEWDYAVEHPELAKDGYFQLKKPNGTTIKAAYNPYIHSSRSMLNDQFSSAWRRPELELLEVKIPESDILSGYKAPGAKDAVGEIDWKSGPVSSALVKAGRPPRRVILSRLALPVRVVPPEEIAIGIRDMLEGTDIGIPINTITPQVRDALLDYGVRLLPPIGTSAKLPLTDVEKKILGYR